VIRPGRTAGDVADFLSKASDDATCAWLCDTAGARTRAEDEGLGLALRRLAPWSVVAPSRLPVPQDMLKRVS
jgi:hypothetical protein